MEGPRFLLAIVLSIAVVILVNIMFPPTPPQRGAMADSTLVDTLPDTVAAPIGAAASPDTATGDTLAADTASGPAAQPEAGVAASGPADTVWIRTDVARYGFSTRGAQLVSVELLEFESRTRDGPVQLVEPADGKILGYEVRVGDRIVSLDGLEFETSRAIDDTIFISGEESLRFEAPLNGGRIEINYDFAPDRYVVGLTGTVTGVGNDATLLLDLGPRLAVNEADSAEDLRALAYVVNSRQQGIESAAIRDIEVDRVEEGPLRWVALKNKYFLAAAIETSPDAAALGGLLARAGEGGATSLQATFPLDRDGAFGLRLFFGPQQYGRLAALGEGLKDVNPYGWRLFRPIIRPLAEIVTWILTGLHNVLGLGYGWVLILFGFAMRAILWPLNAKAMRSQLKTMELQPRIKEIQQKYKEKPEQLQKEMLRLYKEEGFNPLGGCLPLLIPWPVLITLFFVFQNTIEFRGVDFLWLPDLSQPDPFYILPVVLGLSLFALQFMNVRATGSDNPQQKMMMWVMPIMMMVIFLNFASGLNLYYAASNVASLPQQIQIIGERKRAKARIDAKKAKDG